MVSIDMVTSHVETLIERLTGSKDRVKADADGDYPLRYRNAAYFVRVAKPQKPVVQVFSVAVADVDVSVGLVHALNEINSDLSFCRTFWVRGQVLFESEHLGETIGEADFNECVQNVAAASDYFGPRLAERFGGRLLFEESKEPEYQPQNTGFYL